MKKAFIFSILILFSACDRDEKGDVQEMPEPLVLENVKLYDDNGSPIGCHPICDNDWENIDIAQHNVFDWTSELKATSESNQEIELFAVYPNPFNHVQSFAIHSPQEYLLLLEILDEERHSYLQSAHLISVNNFNLTLNYESLEMVNNKIYRVYYKILNKDGDIIYQGYGDIFGCNMPSDYLSCYPN